jgi:carbamoyl-phosphate synthase large subunit
MKDKPKKVLVIGSGAIKIAEAAEFDYSGSQALKVLREEEIESVLVNPNIATVQTSYGMADHVYLLPISSEYIEKVIEKERPDAIMMGFGGQSALNAGVDLNNNGILEKYNVRVIGTPIEGVEMALSREKFKENMEAIGISTPPSFAATNIEEALMHAKELDYPIIIRVSFNLGGRGSIIAYDEKQLIAGLDKAFAQSRSGEILLEKHLRGWKEIEYEVVRDSYGNCAVTACIENMDPMGVHTGESVVVTPAQTLDDHEYQLMRSTAIRVAESIKLVGECNVQFALDPSSYKFYVIETNPRMSRSSALASKATGYPLAYVSAKLALGQRLYDVKNTVSKVTTAFFEPSLDYITIKAARWDLEKFDNVDKGLGTEMKSIGEIMSIGRSIEEALQKAARMLDIGEPGIVGGNTYNANVSKNEIEKSLSERRPYWFLYAAKAFKEGMSIDEIYNLTLVDKFFLEKIRNVVEFYEKNKDKDLDDEECRIARNLGFSNEQLKCRKMSLHIKQIDTLAGEWPAKANYLYTTFNASQDDIGQNKGNRLLVMGAGGFRIGVSVEFDWGTVSLARSTEKSFDVSLLNCNPETVSTDWDEISELYFDELTEETITGIYKTGNFDSIALFAAGQKGNSVSRSLEKNGLRIFGTKADTIDIAEDRKKFSELTEKLGIRQPNWISASSMSDIKKFIDEVGFPVLVRPSYVLSGSAMKVAGNMEELRRYVDVATKISRNYPVIVSKFIEDGIETELDCASDSRNVIGVGLYHIEEAGVHSGDATIVTPYTSKGYDIMKDISLKLANELQIRGPFNIQFVVKDNVPYVIELNLRASRSMPLSSKSVGINLVEQAVNGILKGYEWDGFFEPEHKAYAIKTAQFSWSQLRGAYPHLSPEMRSTGEVAAFGRNINDALIKSWLGATPNRLPGENSKILIYGRSNKEYLLKSCSNLKEFDIVTLEDAEMKGYDTLNKSVILEKLRNKNIDLVITDGNVFDLDYVIRRTAVDLNVPIVLNGRLAATLTESMLLEDVTYEEMGKYNGNRTGFAKSVQ